MSSTRFSGRVVLVTNAATYSPGPVDTLDTAARRAAIATNLDGVFFASRAALPHLRTTRGSIVNVGSVAAVGGQWDMPAYSATKAASGHRRRRCLAPAGPCFPCSPATADGRILERAPAAPPYPAAGSRLTGRGDGR